MFRNDAVQEHRGAAVHRNTTRFRLMEVSHDSRHRCDGHQWQGAALEGIESAFLVTNSSERAEEQQLRFDDGARAAAVRHIVYLSQLHAARNSLVRFLHDHAVVEEAIASSGMAFTHLRPNLYMQGLLAFAGSIKAAGRMLAPRAMRG